MDLPQEELQFLTLTGILKESVRIPKSSTKTFSLITLTLIFPLSFAILAHSLFTYQILNQIQNQSPSNPKTHHQWTLLYLIQFSYLIFLFAFSLLSTAAVVFTVASLYTSKPVSFTSTISAIPRVFKHLFVTFLYVSLLMIAYNFVFISCVLGIFEAVINHNRILLFIGVIDIFFLFFYVHVYFTALWHLASVISILEPTYGFAAMKKSWELLKGKTRLAMVLVFMYLLICGVIGILFGLFVIHGGEDNAMVVWVWVSDVGEDNGVVVRVLVGVVLVGLLVIVNLLGLLVQSIFYYVCKSHHHQMVDKSALYDHLGGYIGEYVLLKSRIEMESLKI